MNCAVAIGAQNWSIFSRNRRRARARRRRAVAVGEEIRSINWALATSRQDQRFASPNTRVDQKRLHRGRPVAFSLRSRPSLHRRYADQARIHFLPGVRNSAASRPWLAAARLHTRRPTIQFQIHSPMAIGPAHREDGHANAMAVSNRGALAPPVIATAGNFMGLFATTPAFQCEKSGETNRTGASR